MKHAVVVVHKFEPYEWHLINGVVYCGVEVHKVLMKRDLELAARRSERSFDEKEVRP